MLAATLYQGNIDRNHKLWNIVSTERYVLHMQVLLECCYIWMESSQWENLNHLFCRKVSFLTDPHCQFQSVGQGMKQTYLYMWSSILIKCCLPFSPMCNFNVNRYVIAVIYRRVWIRYRVTFGNVRYLWSWKYRLFRCHQNVYTF